MSQQEKAGERYSPLQMLSILLSTLFIALMVYIFAPSDMSELSRRMLVIFVVAAIFWSTEIIPLFATSFCIIGLQVLLLATGGGFGPPDGDQIPFTAFFEPFASSIIILFMGGFILARAVIKHDIDKILSRRFLLPLANRPVLLLFSIMGLTAFFSMWISNTATTAMMIAVVIPLLVIVPSHSKFDRALILAVPLGANIGGIGTPIASPPNAVALATLRLRGYEISFVDWMMLALPLVVFLLLVGGALLCLLYRPEVEKQSAELSSDIPALTKQGWITVVILSSAIALWLSSGFHGIADAVIALLAAAALSGFKIINRKDVNSLDWNIIILLWGGLSLGQGMRLTGLVDYVVGQPIFLELAGVSLAFALVLLAVGVSTIMSNTAAANLIIPLALALSITQASHLVILTALACTLAMALPVSTPPNAIAFSTERLPAKSLLLVGGLMSIVSVITLMLGYQFMIPLILER